MSEDTAHLWPATENPAAAAQAVFVLPGLALSNSPPQPPLVVWCGGVVEEVCDGTWIIPGKRSKCYNEGEAAKVLWDAIPDANLPSGHTIEPFAERKYNKNCDGAWRMDIGEIDYGL